MNGVTIFMLRNMGFDLGIAASIVKFGAKILFLCKPSPNSPMVGKTPRARKNERDRMEIIAKYCGCLACLLMGHLDRHTTIEHATEHGRRVGEGAEVHEWTIGLCTWHHFGHTHSHSSRQKMAGEFGPTLAWGRKPFEEHFGDEVKILIPVQNFMLAQFEEAPWAEYSVPRRVARETRYLWIELNHAATSQSSGKSKSG